jgi:prefoldin alpha subunit
MADAQEQLNRLAFEANYWRSAAEDLQRRMVALQSLIEEHRSAAAALGALPEEGKEAFLPLGGGAFLRAKPSGKNPVLLDVGARVFVSTPNQNAVTLLEKREQDLQHQGQRLAQRLQEAAQRLEQLEQAAQALQNPAQATEAKPKATHRRNSGG